MDYDCIVYDPITWQMIGLKFGENMSEMGSYFADPSSVKVDYGAVARLHSITFLDEEVQKEVTLKAKKVVLMP